MFDDRCLIALLLCPEHQLLKSEEDLPPLTRQRSNTLPKSFGSQLERKTPEKAPQPPVESTLEAVQKKLLEKRQEAGRPEDIKVSNSVVLRKLAPHYVTRSSVLQSIRRMVDGNADCGVNSTPSRTGYDTGADWCREGGPAEGPALL